MSSRFTQENCSGVPLVEFSEEKAYMMQRIIRTAFLILIGAAALFGQTSTGEVNGTLTDPSGSAVPGATVSLISETTKIESKVTSNQAGYFTFVNVKPGSYVLRVEM